MKQSFPVWLLATTNLERAVGSQRGCRGMNLIIRQDAVVATGSSDGSDKRIKKQRLPLAELRQGSTVRAIPTVGRSEKSR
jgi:hypothetical protein